MNQPSQRDKALGRLSVIIGLCMLGLSTPLPAAEQATVPAQDALKKRKEGNARFTAGEAKHGHANRAWRESLVKGQRPFAVIVSCSDSRVPTELVFDQGFGDLFVIRNAGNIIATDVLGSIEYALVHLGCKLVLIMGHESCGAVTAALMSEEERAAEPPEVREILDDIVTGLEKAELPKDETKRVAAGVKANVRWSVQQLETLIQQRKPAKSHGVRIAGAFYNLHSGKVEFLQQANK